mmetsp:Transcript_102796/g.329684  ORF Transcript_102796/g.329684 Transcript_102796/m.329684 type:complete len:250 (+) Transcript_102796:524-1273(+)
MCFYCVYATLFAASVAVSSEAEDLQRLLSCAGSACGGIAAGVLWTAQGGYFARTVDLLARKEDIERSTLTSTLASTFAVFYLVYEVATKLLWALLGELHVAEWIIAAVFAAVGVLALLLMTQTMKFSSAGPQVNCTAKARAALSLWQDPVLILVSGLNLSFGFSAAFMGGFVNGTFAKPQLGESAVPMLAAFSATFAAIFARCFGTLEVSIGKGEHKYGPQQLDSLQSSGVDKLSSLGPWNSPSGLTSR